jgi:thiol:disulfide interchange protein
MTSPNLGERKRESGTSMAHKQRSHTKSYHPLKKTLVLIKYNYDSYCYIHLYLSIHHHPTNNTLKNKYIIMVVKELKSVEEFDTLIASSTGLVIVDFTATWCK